MTVDASENMAYWWKKEVDAFDAILNERVSTYLQQKKRKRQKINYTILNDDQLNRWLQLTDPEYR